MNEASRLLFEDKFGNEYARLFNSRLELATSLLKEPESFYYLKDENDNESYNKHLNRLQSYISQIFTGSGTRKITNDFKSSLKLVINKRFADLDTDVDSNSIYENVIKDLEFINSKSAGESSANSINTSLEDFVSDFKNSNYAVVFSSRPLELEANPNETMLTIRNNVVESICNNFLSSSNQKLRYNFPNRHLCILFWRRVSYLVIKRLENTSNGFTLLKAFMDQVYDKNPKFIENFDNNLKKHFIELSNSDINNSSDKLLVHHFFAYLNDRAIFQVFESAEPNFMIPYIIFNPNESNNIKGYIFLDNSTNSLELYKHGNRDLTVWKEKVWDTIKVNRKTTAISYVESIEDNVVFNFI